MSLLGNLYDIKARSAAAEGNSNLWTLALREQSDVFRGHFPDSPVVPGVALIDAVKTLTEREEEHEIEVTAIKNAKFLSVLAPTDVKEITIITELSDTANEMRRCSAVIKSAGQVYAKITIIYRLKEVDGESVPE